MQSILAITKRYGYIAIRISVSISFDCGVRTLFDALRLIIDANTSLGDSLQMQINNLLRN